MLTRAGIENVIIHKAQSTQKGFTSLVGKKLNLGPSAALVQLNKALWQTPKESNHFQFPSNLTIFQNKGPKYL